MLIGEPNIHRSLWLQVREHEDEQLLRAVVPKTCMYPTISLMTSQTHVRTVLPYIEGLPKANEKRLERASTAFTQALLT